MTMALCFNCGTTKFGAICPCPECNISSSGDMDLDIAFSDHRISTATIGAFGEGIRAIRPVCEDDEIRFWSFIRFVSVNCPAVLQIEMPSHQQDQCDAILARANPHPVVVEESPQARFLREHSGTDGEDTGA